MIKTSKKKLAIGILFLIQSLLCYSIYCQASTKEERDAFNKYYDEGCKLLEPYIFLDGVKSKNPSTKAAKRDLRRSIELYSNALRINPESWQSYWFMAKAHQALFEMDKAYESFKMAYSIMPDNPDVANEYMMAAMELLKNQEALTIGEQSVKKFSTHVGLVANYSLVLLFNGRVDEAYSMVQKALELKSDDPVTQDNFELIKDVKSGKRPLPKTYWELVLGTANPKKP